MECNPFCKIVHFFLAVTQIVAGHPHGPRVVFQLGQSPGVFRGLRSDPRARVAEALRQTSARQSATETCPFNPRGGLAGWFLENHGLRGPRPEESPIPRTAPQAGPRYFKKTNHENVNKKSLTFL